ncbi:hypothetical protein MLP_42630 [Microlunatus phosphovorus NM-1]|uniref:DUF2510 domain-containing protein n=1 Tax=Microlunatus phosphovorus (strain ATCC 700054 / DSM 10555 / JCM 9379 / NBRC 101784 / NCIMB 13414 / VKM Ac-1990 / NM-1) TaxID=1032480 RepID=F5XSL9_MICPN|nr:DUF2510 domain-containing protein [Microlunatus phosphovorus]BAK37277.1 hypothetical protein MLP_42630 [Microlunatus phosphovorus NM-1]
MSQPGWYPDPAGAPNRYRYWDGHAWSPETTDHPGGASPPTAQSTGRRRWGPVIMVIAAVVVAVLVGVVVIRGLQTDRPVADPDPGPLPSSTVSGWDDSSATPTLEPSNIPSEAPSRPLPTATPSEARPLRPCPEGMPISRQPYPSDGRMHGGGLSFPRVSGWDDASGLAYSWAYDVGEQSIPVESPDWYANLVVGALFTGDGFDEPKRAADLVMQCVITSGLYPYFTDREEVWSKPVTVDGHSAWSIRAKILIKDPKLKAKGDTVEVIVVDTDSPESLAMFIGQVNLGDTKLLRTLDSTIKNLRVE